ncbi:uncharacterized protein RJT20DRAFT_126258 [Scheffersomyces xylosifermentans]|uniref:uncharacterized protein n=1 Tax=Scheffersomyces xylosifermentans TaxID=1304137 RepID=UPI00315C645C
MPPKSKASKQNTISILKFKRGKTTYVIPFDTSVKSALSLDNLKASLADAIVASGGLELVEKDEPQDPIGDDDEIDEDDIPVPKSEFEDDMLEIDDPNVVKDVSAVDIRLAVPRDKTTPYSNDWLEVDDSALSSIEFNDYDILAFSYGTEDNFNIIEAAYDE